METALTHENFTNQLNTEFQVNGDGEAVELLLTEVSELKNERQEQFSIVFRGPLDRPLSQGTQQFGHPVIGDFELFIVPIKMDAEGYYYEAIFNRLPGTELPT